MRDNFHCSLIAVLAHEGGYVNHPKDPGGATNKGVTQAVYDHWRRSQGKDPRTVKSIGKPEVEAIYRKLYWDACRCDDLPTGVDYAVFDFAVNSGVSRASRYLQRVVRALEDGQIGPVTIAAVKALPAKDVVGTLCTLRMLFLTGLKTFPTFGKGWIRRVEDVIAVSKAMI